VKPPTRQEYDVIMVGRRRPLTQGPMRHARPADNDATDSGLSIVDQVIADSRRTQ
jgi:hypothetical protein